MIDLIELYSMERDHKRYAAVRGRDLIAQNVYDPDQLKDTIIRLDGREVKVVGIESFAINRDPDIPYTLPFAIYYEAIDAT